MNKDLGNFLKSLAWIVFLVVFVVVLLLYFTGSGKNSISLSFCIGILIGVFLMLLPIYVVGEIVDTLHESADALNEILYKLDNWKNE